MGRRMSSNVVEVQGPSPNGVLTVVMNRPKKYNAFNQAVGVDTQMFLPSRFMRCCNNAGKL